MQSTPIRSASYVGAVLTDVVSPTRSWHSRGYLPHFDSGHVIQHVTFHLWDSLPAEAIARIDRELHDASPNEAAIERRERIDAWIDAGHGSCVLRDTHAARMVQDALLHFDGERYRLFAWVVMPNHVHTLLQTLPGWSLSQIVSSWKSYTGRRISRVLRAHGNETATAHVWHREYWDRYVRDEHHFEAVRRYIRDNPVNAGLVSAPHEWMWSSARHERGAGV